MYMYVYMYMHVVCVCERVCVCCQWNVILPANNCILPCFPENSAKCIMYLYYKGDSERKRERDGGREKERGDRDLTAVNRFDFGFFLK